jgi:hypothetical protein
MSKAANGLAIGMVILLPIVFVVVIYLAYPYFIKMPPVSTEELDAKLADYKKIAEEMESRPRDDREALDLLIELVGGQLHRTWGEPPRSDGDWDYAKLEANTEALYVVRQADWRFDRILKDGFVLYSKPDFPPEPYEDYLFALVRWELAVAALDLQHGNADDAYDRFAKTLKVVEAYQSVPFLPMVLTGWLLEDYCSGSLLPFLDEIPTEQQRQILAAFERIPDVRYGMVKALKVEVSVLTEKLNENLDNIRSEPFGKKRSFWVSPFRYMVESVFRPDRDRYMISYLFSRDIEHLESWLESGNSESWMLLKDNEQNLVLFFSKYWSAIPEYLGSSWKSFEYRKDIVDRLKSEIEKSESTPTGMEKEPD